MCAYMYAQANRFWLQIVYLKVASFALELVMICAFHDAMTCALYVVKISCHVAAGRMETWNCAGFRDGLQRDMPGPRQIVGSQ